MTLSGPLEGGDLLLGFRESGVSGGSAFSKLERNMERRFPARFRQILLKGVPVLVFGCAGSTEKAGMQSAARAAWDLPVGRDLLRRAATAAELEAVRLATVETAIERFDGCAANPQASAEGVETSRLLSLALIAERHESLVDSSRFPAKRLCVEGGSHRSATEWVHGEEAGTRYDAVRAWGLDLAARRRLIEATPLCGERQWPLLPSSIFVSWKQFLAGSADRVV